MTRRQVIPTRRSRRARLAGLLVGLARPAVAYPLALAACGLAAAFLALQGGPL